MLEIWSTKTPRGVKSYFIIDTFNYSVYTKEYNAGMWLFEHKKSAEKELKKLESGDI